MQHDHVGAVLYLEHVTFAGLFEEMSLQHLLLCIRVNMLAPMMTSIMLLQVREWHTATRDAARRWAGCTDAGAMLEQC